MWETSATTKRNVLNRFKLELLLVNHQSDYSNGFCSVRYLWHDCRDKIATVKLIKMMKLNALHYELKIA